jgi:hypothetical protein
MKEAIMNRQMCLRCARAALAVGVAIACPIVACSNSNEAVWPLDLSPKPATGGAAGFLIGAGGGAPVGNGGSLPATGGSTATGGQGGSSGKDAQSDAVEDGGDTGVADVAKGADGEDVTETGAAPDVVEAAVDAADGTD